jgi:hypothetical protein
MEYPLSPPRRKQTGSEMGEEIGDFGFGSCRPFARNGPLAVQNKHGDGVDAEDGNGDSESESVEDRGGEDLDPPASGSEDDGARTTAQGREIMKDNMLGGNKISIGCLYMVREFPPKILSFIISSG